MIAKKTTVGSVIIRIIFPIVIIFLILLILGITFIIYQEKSLSNKFYPQVIVDNIELGGKTQDQAQKIFQNKYQPLQNVTISVLYGNQPVATLSAQNLQLKSNIAEILDRAYLIGRSPEVQANFFQRLVSILHLGQFKFYSQINFNKDPVNELIDQLNDQYSHPAKNALFNFENNKVENFRQEEKGLKIKTDKLLSDFNKIIVELKNKQVSSQIRVEDEVIEPEITLASANKFGIEELLAEGKSNFSHSIPERIHNVNLAASKFNGVLIAPKKVFSFNDIIGDISSLTGYKPAYIIKSGKTVLGDGGGVCQVSTTIFRAALNAGLPIIERNAHAYRVSYYENDSSPGLDATIFSPYNDLKFTNDTNAYILIQTDIDNDHTLLNIKFYGKKDNRKVEISNVTVYDVQPPPPAVYQEDPTTPRGITKQIDFPAWGAKANFSYKVTKDNVVTFEKNFFSSYRPWSAVYLVGTKD